jgi:hypothetical protein
VSGEDGCHIADINRRVEEGKTRSEANRYLKRYLAVEANRPGITTQPGIRK